MVEKNKIVRAFYPDGSIRRVWKGPLRGFKYVVRSGPMGATFAFNIEEPDVPFLRKRINPGDTVYDIGANCGRYSLHFSDVVGESGNVVSLEPVRSLADTIKKNRDLNDAGNIHVVAAAAAGEEGTADFAYSSEQIAMGMLKGMERTYQQVEDSQNVEVQTVRLDDLAEELHAPPDLIKIDVQGSAGAVFDGAADILDIHEPDVYIELHGPQEQEAVRDELLERGYTAETLTGEMVEDPTVNSKRRLWCTK